jgi:simple sugar transport system permease protein
VHYRLLETISPGYGYTAIVVALLSYLDPLAVIVVSILFAGLIVGADAMQRVAGLPAALAYVVQGLVVLFVLGSEYFVKRKLKELKIED